MAVVSRHNIARMISTTTGETVARLDYGTVTNLATAAVSVTLDGGQTI